MRMKLRVLAVVGFIISLAWFYSKPGYEPALAAVASLITLISTYLVGQKSTHNEGQNQIVGDNSAAIQAGGDVNVSIRNNSDGDGEC